MKTHYFSLYSCVCRNIFKPSNYKLQGRATQPGGMQKEHLGEVRLLPPPATEQRPTTVKPPHFSPKPSQCFQHDRPQYSSLYLLTSVYVIHIQTRNLQHFDLPNERIVRSVYTLHNLVVGCRFRFCTCRRAFVTHFLLLCAKTCLLRNVSSGLFCAFFQDLSLQEFRLAIPAIKTWNVRGCTIQAFVYSPTVRNCWIPY